MKLHILVHKAEEGGYWAAVPSIPGCVAQGDSLDELLENVRGLLLPAYPSVVETLPCR